MRSIVGNDARSQMRLRQRHAALIVPAGAPTIDKMIPFVERETRLHTCQPINDRPCPFECVARLVEIAGGARFENHPYTLPSSVDNVSATFVPSVPALAPAIFFANSSTVATGNGIIFTPPDCVSMPSSPNLPRAA